MSEPRVLIVRFSAIGDCIMSAWAVTGIRLAYPKAYIAWAVQSQFASVIDTDRMVDLCHELPRERWKSQRWSPATWREQVVAYTLLRRHKFDYGFDFHGHSKTALLLRLANPRQRVSSSATDRFVRMLNPVRDDENLPQHEVERNISLVNSLLPITEPEKPYLPTFRHAVPELERATESGQVITIQTGTSAKWKIYPAELWSEVAELLAKPNRTIIALGGPTDPVIEHPDVQNFVGKCDLSSAFAAVADSTVHVAADTGTGHAAAAFGVPTVSLFGPTDPARYAPWSPLNTVLRNGKRAKSIPPSDVAAAVENSLQGVARAHSN
ncbi:MAG: hypothetical protein IH944_10195 [Armatimonadetes bacterium]|nr:hypothetical protein [Armatimonadota bacterium]